MMKQSFVFALYLLMACTHSSISDTNSEQTSCKPINDLVERDPCPVNGGWEDWSNWQTCPVTCGTGLIKRTRTCSNPEPTELGQGCFGDATDYKLCKVTLQCPIDGYWSSWSTWTCTFVRPHSLARQRQCYDPLFGGQDTCIGGNTAEFRPDPKC